MTAFKKVQIEILVIIVLYKIKLEDSTSFITLSASMNDASYSLDLLVYDNSPEPQLINELNFHKWKIHYIHNPENGGVSIAYNRGAELASTLNKSWLLLVDQDSSFPFKSIDLYFNAIKQHQDIQLFCPILQTESGLIISPSVFKFHRGFSPKIMQPGLKSLYDYSPVNSGLCVSLSLFNKAGGYKNLIKLDYSDFYFIEKVKLTNYVFCVIDMVVKHNLSSFEKQSLSAAVARFEYLCKGAILSCNTVIDKFQVLIMLLLRGGKLTVEYRSLNFIKIIFNAFIFSKS